MEKRKTNKKRKERRMPLGITLFAILCLLITGNRSLSYINGQNERITNTINDIDDVLLNPAKGWVLYGTDIYGNYADMVNIVYHRFEWAELNPEKDTYNWKLIDDAIANCAKENKKFSFGVMSANTWSSHNYVTPKWVFDEGAGVDEVTVTVSGKEIKKYIPKWKDEIFLNNLNNFINVLGERYNGNENIAYIDIRSYGNYGEQHLFDIKDDSYVYHNKLAPEELKELYIRPYMNAFPDTLLVNPWGEKSYNDVYKWAIDHGVTIRRDGIFVYSDGSECLLAENKLPTIYEFSHSYKTLVKKGEWSAEKLLEYVENGKPSYMKLEMDMCDENRQLCNYLANRLGYYFRIKEITYDKEISLDTTTNIKLKFKNDGVTPIFQDTSLYVALLNEEDNIVTKIKTNIDAKEWKPDHEKEESIELKLDGIEAKDYKIAVGLFEKGKEDKPTYLFGSEGKTKDNWYVLGTVKITEAKKQEVEETPDSGNQNNGNNNNSSNKDEQNPPNNNPNDQNKGETPTPPGENNNPNQSNENINSGSTSDQNGNETTNNESNNTENNKKPSTTDPENKDEKNETTNNKEEDEENLNNNQNLNKSEDSNKKFNIVTILAPLFFLFSLSICIYSFMRLKKCN